MTRYEKLKKDCIEGKVDVEIFTNFLNFCPADESVFGLKYGDDIVEKPEYIEFGIRIGCKNNRCSLCWQKEYTEFI